MYEQLKNPPITEALLDIRVALPPESNLDVLSKYHEKIKDRFPEKQVRWQRSFQFQFKEDQFAQSESKGRPDGYFFKSSIDQKIVQARLDGFTFNKLKPYSDWETFSSEAKILWEGYNDIAHPQRVTRLALRYINRINLPLPVSELKDYILTAPELAPDMPNSMDSFLMQVVVSNKKIEATANIIERIEAPINNNTAIPLIFDIDVFKTVNLASDSHEVWTIMESLRDFKNNIFHSSVTQKTKELLNA